MRGEDLRRKRSTGGGSFKTEIQVFTLIEE